MVNVKKMLKPFLVKHLLSYNQADFVTALRKLGVSTSDRLMVHSSWLPLNGFKGRPIDLIEALKLTIGPHGLLVMPTLTYQNQSSRDFLLSGKLMNVRRSPSMMGLLSEVFRRGKDVHRSLSPTHPLTAWGEDSEEFVAGHGSCLSPFGPGTPFDKLLKLNGKILCIDTPFSTITFTHFLEDRITPFLPFELYESEPLAGKVIDYDGNILEVPVKVLSQLANRLRREQVLIDELNRHNIIKKKRIGNTHLLLIDCRAMTESVDEMTKNGILFFDLV
jgi:aminoglycoside 3-N-acetyltransferase